MEKNMNGLSLEFIIHPGDTIKELLEDRKMSQEELAIRTGFSPKHISEVVNGKKGISPSFAKALEYVFEISVTFWINLQGIYDKEILEFREQEEIEDDEIAIVESLDDLIDYGVKLKILDKKNSIFDKIIQVRALCNVKKLQYISKLEVTQIANKNFEMDPYILYVWLRICEIKAVKSGKKYDSDIEDSINKLEKFKEIIHGPKNKSIAMLAED